MAKMKVPFVDLNAQYKGIKKEIDTIIKKVISEKSFILGKYVEEFEKNFASYCEAKYCIAVGNGTDALTLALKSLGLKENDEVLIPANTFIATAEAVTLSGAKPVFVDIEDDSYHIDLKDAERKISKRTRVIIPVHLYGQSVQMDRIRKFADTYNLKIVQDCAQSHGAKYNGKPLISFGDVCCYSFYPGKNLGAYGDAGAIVTNNEDIANFVKMYRNHGRLNKFDHVFEGTNSRMDGIQGAILNVKLKYLDEWNRLRKRNAHLYNQMLEGIEEVITPIEINGSDHVYHLYVIRTQNREKLIEYLSYNNISTGIHYPIALPFLKAYSSYNYKQSDFKVSYKHQNEILSLPMYPELSENQIEYVTQKIRKFFK